MRHAGVAQAAVIAREDAAWGQAAGGLCGGGRRWSCRMRLRCGRIVAQSVPDYMVPSAFVVLERLPLTPNGKLDRRALPAPELRGLDGCGGRRARRRRRSCARCLPKCWGLSGSASTDNFFELGGDSIISIQLVSRARKAGLVITPRAVFQHQTVEALAAVAASVEKTASDPARHRHRCIAAHTDHALAAGAWRADRALQPSDAAAGSGRSARGSFDCRPAGRARSSRCVAAAPCCFCAMAPSCRLRFRLPGAVEASDLRSTHRYSRPR